MPTGAASGAEGSRGYWGMLTRQEQQTLRASASLARFPSSTPLVQQGTPLSHVAIIRSGWAKATAVTPDGHEVMLRLYGPGDVVGAGHVLAGDAPTETVVAGSGGVHAMILTVRRFAEFVAHARNASHALQRVLHQRLAEADRFRLLRTGATGLQRVSGLLLELCHDRYSPRALRSGALVIPPVPLSQQELANWIGVSRKTVVRALAELRRRGVTGTGAQSSLSQRIVVNDVARLRALADPAGTASRVA